MKLNCIVACLIAIFAFSLQDVKAQANPVYNGLNQYDQVFKRYRDEANGIEDLMWFMKQAQNNAQGEPGNAVSYIMYHVRTDSNQTDVEGYPVRLIDCFGIVDDQLQVAWAGHSLAATFTMSCLRYDPDTGGDIPFDADYEVTAIVNANEQPDPGVIFVTGAPWGWGEPPTRWFEGPGCNTGFGDHNISNSIYFFADVNVKVNGQPSPANRPGLYRQWFSNQQFLNCIGNNF